MTTFEEVQGKLLTSIGTKAENKDTSSEELAYLAEAMKGIGPSANVTEFASIKTQGVSEVTAALDTLKGTIAQAEANLVEDVAKAQRAKDNVVAIFGSLQAVDAARKETATASMAAATSATTASTAATASAQSANAADTANKAAQTAKTETLGARDAAAVSKTAAEASAKASAASAAAADTSAKAAVGSANTADTSAKAATTARTQAEAASEAAASSKAASDAASKTAATSATAATAAATASAQSATAADTANKAAQTARTETLAARDAAAASKTAAETSAKLVAGYATAADTASKAAQAAKIETLDARDAVSADAKLAAAAVIETREVAGKVKGDIKLANITDMSDAGRDFAKLGSYAAMFEAIKQPASNTSRGVVWVCNEREVMDPTNNRDVITPAMLEYWLKQKKLGGAGMDYSRTGWVNTTKGLYTKPHVEEEGGYFDITISPVSDFRKCTVTFIGAAQVDASIPELMAESVGTMTGHYTHKVIPKLTSNTNLRLCVPFFENPGGGQLCIAGRWTVGAPS